MRKFLSLSGIAAAAVLSSMALTGTAAWAQDPPATTQDAPEKKVKDQGEYDISDAVVKDILKKDFNQAVKDLDTWTQKYPDTDYRDDRTFEYLQAYAQANPPMQAKALDTANKLMGMDLATAFKGHPEYPFTIYFLALRSARTIADPTPDQIAVGDKAAHKMLEYLPTYFTDANKPTAISAADWANTRKQVEDACNDYMFYEAVIPSDEAFKKSDWAAADAGYTKALGAYPNKSYLSYQLAQVYSKENKTSEALYEYARVVAIDPTLGNPSGDPNKVKKFVQDLYDKFHGSHDGYDQLIEQAKASPLPPAGFKIEDINAIKAAQQNAWNQAHPEDAVWQSSIKPSLVSQGAAFFDSSMKDAGMPPLKGTLIEAKPGDCRPKELVVSIPAWDNDKPPAEVTLRLVNAAGKPEALTTKVETGTPISFSDAVAKEFTATPFMVTMEIEKGKIEGLNTSPCAAPAGAGRGVTKGVTKKK